MAQQRLTFGPFVFDPLTGALRQDGRPVQLGNRAAGVLRALLDARGEVVSKTALMEFAWPGSVVEESNLSVQIAALRKILGRRPDGAEWIATAARVGYRFTGEVIALQRPESPHTEEVASRPSLVVLPFDNLSNDPAQDYFADGVTEDIIAALSKFRWFFVLARNSSFAFKGKPIGAREVAQLLGVKYVLSGSVRKSEQRIRISAQLTDSRTATQLWGDHYDFDLGELFSVQDEIMGRVVGAIEPELLRTESALAMRKRTGQRDMTGWDLVHQGTSYFHKITRPTHLHARALFREACAVDPALSEAYAWVARANAGIVAYGWSENDAADLRDGIAAALRAVELDEVNPYAHYALAIISVFASEFDQAIRAGQRAVEVSPAFALGHLVLGMACLYSGDAVEAIGSLEHGLRLNSHDPQNFVWFNILALAHYFAGQPAAALRCATNALKVRPHWRPAIQTMICCYGSLGDVVARARYVAQLEQCPAAADALAPLKHANPRWAAEMTQRLQEAGATSS